MKNKIVSENGETYRRLFKTTAEKLFNQGDTIYVMSIDRNPVNSLTEAHAYFKGCNSPTTFEKGQINKFDDLLTDFSEWLSTVGYGRMPQKYMAKKQMFSYWVKLLL